MVAHAKHRFYPLFRNEPFKNGYHHYQIGELVRIQPIGTANLCLLCSTDRIKVFEALDAGLIPAVGAKYK